VAEAEHAKSSRGTESSNYLTAVYYCHDIFVTTLCSGWTTFWCEGINHQCAATFHGYSSISGYRWFLLQSLARNVLHCDLENSTFNGLYFKLTVFVYVPFLFFYSRCFSVSFQQFISLQVWSLTIQASGICILEVAGSNLGRFTVLLKSMSSELWRRVVMRQDTNVSENFAASIFRILLRRTSWKDGFLPQHFTASQPEHSASSFSFSSSGHN